MTYTLQTRDADIRSIIIILKKIHHEYITDIIKDIFSLFYILSFSYIYKRWHGILNYFEVSILYYFLFSTKSGTKNHEKNYRHPFDYYYVGTYLLNCVLQTIYDESACTIECDLFIDNIINRDRCAITKIESGKNYNLPNS